MATVGENFRRNLRKFLDAKGLSNAELGRTVNVSGATVGQWLDGDNLPRLGRIEAIAEALGVDPLALLSDSGEAITIPDRELDAILRELAKVRGYELVKGRRS
jgi:transcriptional regulator with XRE-family HTH domain